MISSCVFILFVTQVSFAATIVVQPGEVLIADNNRCSLREAIINANDDGPTHDDCDFGIAGDLDTIELASSSIYTLPDGPFGVEGNTGLPVINSPITINGNGSTIQRDPSLPCILDTVETADEFRMIHMAGNSAADILTINDITMKYGCADGAGFTGYGGAIRNNGGVGSTVEIHNSIFSDNRALNGGAATGITNNAITRIYESTFFNNHASVRGGAIYSHLATLEVHGSTFTGNSSGASGGAVVVDFPSPAISSALIQNSTISGNVAGDEGGGIWIRAPFVDLVSSTIVLNEAAEGGGAYIADVAIEIKNSIVALNSAPIGGDCSKFVTATLAAFGNNLDSDGTCNALDPDFTTVTPGQLNLSPLGDFGGPTQTHALQFGSVAIDAVTDCTSFVAGDPILTDQRGIARPQLPISTCDIGAFEARTFEMLAEPERVLIRNRYSAPFWCGKERQEMVVDGVTTITIRQYETEIDVSFPSRRILALFPAPSETARILATLTLSEPSRFLTAGTMSPPVLIQLDSERNFRINCTMLRLKPIVLDEIGEIDQLLDDILEPDQLFHGLLTLLTDKEIKVKVTKKITSHVGTDDGAGLVFFSTEETIEQSEIKAERAFGFTNTSIEVPKSPVSAKQLQLVKQKLQSSAEQLVSPVIQMKSSSLSIRVQGASRIALEVYSLGGKLIHEASSRGNQLQWNLRDRSGRPVANGVYLYRVSITAPNSRAVRHEITKLVIMR